MLYVCCDHKAKENLQLATICPLAWTNSTRCIRLNQLDRKNIRKLEEYSHRLPMEVACEERDRFAAHDRTQNTKAPPRVRTTGLVLTDGAVSMKTAPYTTTLETKAQTHLDLAFEIRARTRDGCDLAERSGRDAR